MVGPSRWHRTVARLSADLTGTPQIVTTNFDLLFEAPGVMNVVKSHVPPTFPDLRHDQPISGITYLHGRLNTLPEGPHNYVLSSADFGRAYLADGWATNFMWLLLERYTVVLLRYTANDPPMKYLLQGLNSADALEPDKLFAFDRGEPDKVEAKWRDRGVTPILYGGGSAHAALWDSLDAWAVRADDPYINATSTRECMFGTKFAAHYRLERPSADIEIARNQRLIAQAIVFSKFLESLTFWLTT